MLLFLPLPLQLLKRRSATTSAAEIVIVGVAKITTPISELYRRVWYIYTHMQHASCRSLRGCKAGGTKRCPSEININGAPNVRKSEK